MNFSTITVLLFLLFYYRKQVIFSRYVAGLRYKYKAGTWHSGFFADRKLIRILNPEDKEEFKAKAKKLDRIFLYFLLYTIFIFMLSGMVFNGKL